MTKYWWDGNPEEKYWMENTDRSDIGSNLKAPQKSDTGKNFWGYNFLKLMKPGDVVLHYDANLKSITHFSIVESQYSENEIEWKARGSYARERGSQKKMVPSYQVPLMQLTKLDRPISIETVEAKRVAIQEGYNEITGSRYAPFDNAEKRKIGAFQTYISKFPKFMIEIFNITELGDEKLSSYDEERKDSKDISDSWKEDYEIESPTYRPQTKREGMLQSHLRTERSRNRTLPKIKVREAIERDGAVFCVVCHEDWQSRFGTDVPIIDCHHLTPLGTNEESVETGTEDLALVCPTCHRALHRMEDPSDIDGLRLRLLDRWEEKDIYNTGRLKQTLKELEEKISALTNHEGEKTLQNMIQILKMQTSSLERFLEAIIRVSVDSVEGNVEE